MKKRDLNSLKQAWDKSANDLPELDALSIIPAGVREDMINCLLKVHASTGDTPQTVSGQYSLFVKLLTLIWDFYHSVEIVDLLEYAKFEYDRVYENEFLKWPSMPIIDPRDFMEFNNGGNEVFAIFEKSPFFDMFLDELKASGEDRIRIHQLIKTLAEGKLLELPSRVPDCIVGKAAARLLRIYSWASELEWRQVQAEEFEKQEFQSTTLITLKCHKAISDKYPDIIAEWEWYWKDRNQEMFSIASKMLMQKDLGATPMDNEHQAESYEFFLTGILYWDIILKHWPEYIFSYLLPKTLQDVYMQMKFARFLNLHPDGNAFKTMYSKYCSENSITPLIYVKHLEIDTKGQDKLWILPPFKELNTKAPIERYKIICRLFDILDEWGAFGKDIDTFSLKTLFAYRFSGVMPIREIQEKLPWAKSKTELALLIYILTEGSEGRPPYKLVNSFFDINDLNIAALTRTANDKPMRTLILRAFEQDK